MATAARTGGEPSGAHWDHRAQARDTAGGPAPVVEYTALADILVITQRQIPMVRPFSEDDGDSLVTRRQDGRCPRRACCAGCRHPCRVAEADPFWTEVFRKR